MCELKYVWFLYEGKFSLDRSESKGEKKQWVRIDVYGRDQEVRIIWSKH